MSTLIDYAIGHARLTIATLHLPAVRRHGGLCDHTEGSRAGRPGADHLCAAVAARHQPGGFRAAVAASGRDPAQVGRQRQGDALDRVRGRRLRAARVRGRLRFQVGARRRARQGRPVQARPAQGRRRAAGAGGQSLALSGAGGGALGRRAGAHAAAHRPRRQELHRAGAGRARGRAARRPRRGGRDHRRADADEELRGLARPVHHRFQLLQQPDRGRRARRRDRPLRRQGAEPDRASAGRAESPGGGDLRRLGHARRSRRDQADLQGRDLGHPGQRQVRHDDRGVQAHRRQPDRDRRCREGDRGGAAEDLAGSRACHLHPGQVQDHPADAGRPAELGRDRRAPGGGGDPVRARLPGLAVHRHRHSGLVPGRRARAAARRADRQHRGAVLAHPRGRHAGRRRHHRVGVRRAPDVGGDGAEGGLFARRQAHVGTGDRRDRDPHRRVLAAPVLARRRRRVHEVPAHHPDRDAVGVARGGAVLHPHARLAARQGIGGAARRRRPPGRRLYAHGAARHRPSGLHAWARRSSC